MGDYISDNEFKEARSRLRSSMSKSEVDKVEFILRGALDERQASQKGIDTKELDRAVEYMRKNQSKLGFSSDKLDRIEKTLREKI